ncbi:MAG: tandem-95 repeat protein [Chloroflexota bacterium]
MASAVLAGLVRLWSLVVLLGIAMFIATDGGLARPGYSKEFDLDGTVDCAGGAGPCIVGGRIFVWTDDIDGRPQRVEIDISGLRGLASEIEHDLYVTLSVEDLGDGKFRATGVLDTRKPDGTTNQGVPREKKDKDTDNNPAPTATPTSTPTNTPVPTNTLLPGQPTPTNTLLPGQPTLTPTATTTPQGGPAVATPTATATPGGPTLTPTATVTPAGPTATFTSTPTPAPPGPTATFTATPTLTATPTPTSAIPAAVNDPFSTLVGVTLTVPAGVGPPAGLLVNDSLGAPAATVTFFGGGSLGGSVTTNAAGAAVALAGGTLQVNANGSLSLTTPSVNGSYTFQYRLANAAGFSDATITIVVGQAPGGVTDGGYVALVGSTLTVASGSGPPPGLLTNDTLGFPAATITLFGAATPNTAAGTGLAFAGGTLTVNANGSFSLANPTVTGSQSFVYRLANAVGTSDVTVSVDVRQAPTAVADSYSTTNGVTLTVPAGTGPPPGLLVNDTRGAPLATVASFGGGSLAGTAASNAAGTSVALAGGTLTVDALGSLTLTTPSVNGTYTFQYRLSNAAGFSDATVTIVVGQAPGGVTDGGYVALVGSTLTVPVGAGPPADLLNNDTLGFPSATITLFGATTPNTAAGTGLAFAGGTLTVNANGSFSLANPTVTGAQSFVYRLANSVGTSDVAVNIDVRQAPVAVADGPYAATAGSTLTVPAVTGLLGNDTLGAPSATVTFFGGGSLGGAVTDHAFGTAATFGTGGSLTVDADGSFTFTPASGLTGTFTFQYRLANAAGFSDATVTITVGQAPSAVTDGGYAVPIGSTLTVTSGFGPPPGLLINDTLGFPAAPITLFGAATPTTTAGTGLAFAGGTLTVNADGSFSLANPTVTGSQTFVYRLANSVGSSDATVSIEVRQAPAAVADGPYNVNAGATLTVPAGAGPPAGLRNNDTLGFPVATVASYGGGSLGSAVTDHAAGDTAPLAGGTLKVNADGSFTLTTPTTTGAYTFQYRLTNSAGSSDATITINVNGPPGAVNDPSGGIPSNSTPPSGANPNPYHISLNTTLTVPAGAGPPPGLLVNDSLGFPAATLTSFGAGSLGGAVTDHAFGTTATFGTGGSLAVNADGSFTFTPSNNFTGLFLFQYRIANTGGSAVGTVSIAVGFRPVATNDSATATGNVKLDTALMTTPLSVLTNDVGDQLTLSLTGPSSANGGEVTMTTSGLGAGRFTFNPKVGLTGADSFTYSISNGFGPSTGTVTVTVSNILWFVNNNPGACSASCDGRFTNPFTSLASFGTANGTANGPAGNETIFVYETESTTPYTGPATLLPGQKLVGQDASSSLETIAGFTVANGSPAMPAMDSANARKTTITSSGNGVVLNNANGSNSLRGLTLGTATGDALNGGSFGTLTLANGTTEAADVTITTTGRAVNLATGSVNGALASTTSSGGTNNVTLTTIGGTFNLGSGALSGSAAGAANHAFALSGGGGAVSYGGTIAKTTTGDVVNVTAKTSGSLTLSGNLTCNTSCTGVDISSNSGGTMTLSGSTKTINTGGNVAVNLTSNTGATITFSNGGLDVDTTSATGFNATGGGTVNVTTGTNPNTINSTTGTALNVASTTIGSSGLTFRGISSNGAGSGIVLSSTGSSGGLTVTGDGGATSNGSGGTITASTGAGVSLSSTSSVSLGYMNIQNSADDGVSGSSVAGFSLTRSTVSNNGNDTTADEGIGLSSVSGAVSITNSTISNSPHHNISIDNLSSPTLSSLTISNNSITGSTGANGVFIQIRGTSTLTSATVSGNTISNNTVIGMQVISEDSATISSFTASGNTFRDTGTGNSQEIAMDFAQGSTSTMSYVVDSNVMTGHNAQAFNTFTAAGVSTGGSLTGVISNNTVGDPATIDSGSKIGNGMRININGQANAVITVSNNTINQVPAGRGIEVIGRNGTGGLKVKVVGNTVNAPTGTAGTACGAGVLCPLAPIFVGSNAVTVANTVCSVVGGTATADHNTVFDPTTFAAGGESGITLAESNSSTHTTEGNTGQTAVQNMQARNTSQNNSASAAAGVAVVATGTCGTFP